MTDQQSAQNTELHTKIRQFVLATFPAAKESIADEESLLETGIVDSMGVLDIVTFLEEEVGIAIEDEDMVPDNFETIGRILEFVHAKRA